MTVQTYSTATYATTVWIQTGWNQPLQQEAMTAPPAPLTRPCNLVETIALHWHDIRAHRDDYGGDDSGDDEFFYDCLYDERGWLGLSVSNWSNYENDLIVDYVEKNIRRLHRRGIQRVIFMDVARESGDSADKIGHYEDNSRGMWFREERDRKAFKKFLSTIPKRTQYLLINDPNKPETFSGLRGINYCVVKGTDAIALSLPDMTEDELMLVKLAAT